MQTHQIVGIALIGAAVFDVALLPVVRARAADDRQRALITLSIASSALLILGLGGLFLAGVIDMGS